MLALIFSMVEEAIKLEPALALELHNLFSTPNPTAADWLALREKVLGETFEALAPAAAANLPPVTQPETVTAPPITVPPPVLAPEVASAEPAPVTCQKCGQALIPDHPNNCTCA
jgi:hypothetical protein